MEGIEIIFVIIAAIAIATLLTIAVRKVSAYYRREFNYSIWSGVALVILSFALTGYGLYNEQSINIWLIIASVIVFAFSVLLDIRHAGLAMGLLALLLQIVLALFFILVILMLFVIFCVRAIIGKSERSADFSSGILSGEVVSIFLRSFLPW